MDLFTALITLFNSPEVRHFLFLISDSGLLILRIFVRWSYLSEEFEDQSAGAYSG